MVFEIVQRACISVTEGSVAKPDGYTSFEYQIGVFNDYKLWFTCSEDDEYVSIYLILNCPVPVTIVWDCTVNSMKKTATFTFEKGSKQGFSNFGKKTELFRNYVMKIVSTLTVKFTRKMIRDLTCETPHSVSLLDDEEYKDFTIQVEGQEIKVHKCILSSASSVFAAMLQPHTKEFQESKVNIVDFDYETVKAAVKLMYTRKMDYSWTVTTLLNLYKFADKYDLVDLQKVVYELYDRIDLTTITEISQYSKANGMDNLYQECVYFFSRNFGSNIDRITDLDGLDPVFVMDALKRCKALRIPKMVFEIVQKGCTFVPEGSIAKPDGYTSYDYRIGVFNDYKFRLNCSEKNGYVSIYLILDCPLPVTIDWDCAVNSIKKSATFTFEKDSKQGFSIFGRKTELLRSSMMIVNSTLTVKFTPKMMRDLAPWIPHSVSLLDNEQLKDFTIQVEGQEIMVHRNIIAAASSVFAAMLQPHTKEFQESKVNIVDFDFETVKAAVKLMYTRKMDYSWTVTTLLNLHKFADKYDLVDLTQISEELYDRIDLTTIAEISQYSKANGMD
uniref:BTB domain-containing protein n=1 Tax=Panagrolaimus sp. JU765 TaxID=591449 RepID=A0AC34Q878_9BILA